MWRIWKFESHLTKQNEALYLQNKVNCEQTMRDLDVLYGPFDDDEIDYYIERLSKDGKFVINSFQKDLVFNLFYKYFGDSVSIKAINSRDYIKLVIAAKRMLEANNLIVLPYIISSRINRLMTRKNVNKKELTKLQNSQSYSYIKEKYKNPKIENLILSMIAGILSSEFEIIDYNNDEIDGKIISSLGDYLIEEMLTYISLI